SRSDAYATFRQALRWGKSAWSWNTRPQPRRSGGTSTPRAVSSHTSLHSTRPARGRESPAMTRRTVVLPAPEGPARASGAPAATSNPTPSASTRSINQLHGQEDGQRHRGEDGPECERRGEVCAEPLVDRQRRRLGDAAERAREHER